MGEWWLEFLAFVRKFATKPFLLLVDNHSSHADLVDPRNQATLMEYPANCTSKHQLMDQGVIAAWKMHYKPELLKVRVDTMESAPKLWEQARARGMSAGTMGLAEGYRTHVFDAAEIAVQAWEKISQLTIARCWLKADTLPVTMKADFAQTWGKKARGNVGASANESLDDLANVMASLSVGVKRGFGNEELCHALSALRIEPGEKPSNDSLAAAEAWLSLEDDEEVITALRLDLQDELMSEATKETNGRERRKSAEGCGECDAEGSSIDGEGDVLSEDRDASGETAVNPPPPYSHVADSLGFLEEAASANALHDVSFYLRKAKLAWMSARSNPSARQSKILEFMGS